MNDNIYKYVIQGLVLICIVILAWLGMFDKESIKTIFLIIIGYIFATAKNSINKE
jgi:hypothetical protein